MSIRTRTGGFIGFAQNEVSIKNSEFRNGVITSDGDRAGGLIAHASQVVTIDRVHCGNLMVTGQTTSGGGSWIFTKQGYNSKLGG